MRQRRTETGQKVVTARGTEAREQYERMRHIAFTSLPKGDFSPQTTIKVIMEFVASDELVTLACSVIGDQREVEAGLASLIEQTQPDELMVTAQIYDHAARLRSFEITAQARAAVTA